MNDNRDIAVATSSWLEVTREINVYECEKIPNVSVSPSITLPFNTNNLELIDFCFVQGRYLVIVDYTKWDTSETFLRVIDTSMNKSIDFNNIGSWCFVTSYRGMICIGEEGDKYIKCAQVEKLLDSQSMESFTEFEVPEIRNVSVSKDLCRLSGYIIYESKKSFVLFDVNTHEYKNMGNLNNYWSMCSLPNVDEETILVYNTLKSDALKCVYVDEHFGFKKEESIEVPESVSFIIGSSSSSLPGSSFNIQNALIITQHDKVFFEGEQYRLEDLVPKDEQSNIAKRHIPSLCDTKVMSIQPVSDDVYIYFSVTCRRFYLVKIIVA